MKKRPSLTIYFVFFLLLSIVLLILSKVGFLKPIEPVFQIITAPIEAITYNSFEFVTNFTSNGRVKNLEKQNDELSKKLINQERLLADNKALRDQFQTQNIRSDNLIMARIIGAPGFLPGFSIPEKYTVDRGEYDGVRVGDAVIYKNSLLGKVVKVTKYLSSVMPVTNSSSLLTSKTLKTNAIGVVKGQGGGGMVLDNVTLSDELKIGDLVLTKGNVDVSGEGLVSDLIIGEIIAVSKNPSDLFQKAKIKSRIDFSKIDNVFIMISPR